MFQFIHSYEVIQYCYQQCEDELLLIVLIASVVVVLLLVIVDVVAVANPRA